MRIVAVGAFDQPFVHTMVERLGKVRLHLQVTAITELRLRYLQQLALHPRMVNGMAVNAPNIVLKMFRAQEVGMLFSKFMAAQATLRRFFPRQTGKADDLGRVSRLGMLLTRTVTCFATLPLRPRVLGQDGFPVRPLIEALADVLVAGLASIRTYILRRIHLVIIRVLRGQVGRSILLLLFLLIAATVRIRSFSRLAWRIGKSGSQQNKDRSNDCCPQPVPSLDRHRQASRLDFLMTDYS